MTTAVLNHSTEQRRPLRRQEWMPRIWQGCHFFAWLRLLVRNRFAVHPSCWYIAVIATVVTFWHTVLRYVQQGLYGRKVARMPLREAPLFIIGHWRTGTTLLHEMLILDDRHTYPNTYECFEPNHFLLTERLITGWMPFLMPAHRPMDNMAAGWDRPQEDEFALCMMGQPSPYLAIAFPNHGPQYPEYLDLRGLSAGALAGWKRDFLRFLQRLSYKDPRRLILKSPPHTARIRVLLELFPDARFVHIVRDPYVIFPSTVNLWKSLYRTHALQRPTFAGLEEYVFTTFNRLYESLERDRGLVPPGRFHEVRYEELVRDPLGQMRTLYERLQLGGFDEIQPRLEDYIAKTKGYETNRYELEPKRREEITHRWGKVIRQYGYSEDKMTG